MSAEGKNPLKLRASCCITFGTDENPEFREADIREDVENVSELEPVSKSLEMLKEGDTILVEGGGRETREQREKRKESEEMGGNAGSDQSNLIYPARGKSGPIKYIELDFGTILHAVSSVLL